jgi:Domain of unknown function (DUF4216)
LIQALAVGPSREVTKFNRYSINGFNFHTVEYGKDKCSMNYGIYIKSTHDYEFYGVIDEIIELSYFGSNRPYKTILFKCTWYDNSKKGQRVHPEYKIVEINRKGRYSKEEPFALGHQAYQAYYAPCPTTLNDTGNWEVVFKTKSRTDFDAPIDETNEVFQEEAISNSNTSLSTINIDDIINEDDFNGDEKAVVLEVHDLEEEEEEEEDIFEVDEDENQDEDEEY